jgi:hypothetical protein
LVVLLGESVLIQLLIYDFSLLALAKWRLALALTHTINAALEWTYLTATPNTLVGDVSCTCVEASVAIRTEPTIVAEPAEVVVPL